MQRTQGLVQQALPVPGRMGHKAATQGALGELGKGTNRHPIGELRAKGQKVEALPALRRHSSHTPSPDPNARLRRGRCHNGAAGVRGA